MAISVVAKRSMVLFSCNAFDVVKFCEAIPVLDHNVQPLRYLMFLAFGALFNKCEMVNIPDKKCFVFEATVLKAVAF